MIAASSLAFPPSKPLALWWRQLAPHQPQALWVGHLFVHRLEALAQVVRFEPVEPLSLLLLRTVALEQASDPPSEDGWRKRLDDRLHLGQAVLGRLLSDLQTQGLLSSATQPALTEVGRLVAEKAGYPRRHWQRREFSFVERLRPDGQRSAPPHFLALGASAAPAWQPDEKCAFDVAGLSGLDARPQAWKEQFGFSAEVVALAAPGDDAAQDPPAWQRVVIDRPERLLLAIIAAGQQLLGFAARQEGWELHSAKPIFTLPASLTQEVPELAEPIDVAGWTKVWETWCLGRQIPIGEIRACTLALTGARLHVQAPPGLVRRLEAAKNDILKGATWLLAGDGYLRSAVQVQLAANSSA